MSPRILVYKSIRKLRSIGKLLSNMMSYNEKSVYIAGRSTDEGNTSMEGGKRAGSMGEEGDSNYYLQFASKGNKHLKTTVIICCPNTTYYEFMYYEVDIVIFG